MGGDFGWRAGFRSTAWVLSSKRFYLLMGYTARSFFSTFKR